MRDAAWVKVGYGSLPGALDVPIVLAIRLHVIVGHPEVHDLGGEPAARARQCRY